MLGFYVPLLVTTASNDIFDVGCFLGLSFGARSEEMLRFLVQVLVSTILLSLASDVGDLGLLSEHQPKSREGGKVLNENGLRAGVISVQ